MTVAASTVLEGHPEEDADDTAERLALPLREGDADTVLLPLNDASPLVLAVLQGEADAPPPLGDGDALKLAGGVAEAVSEAVGDALPHDEGD